MATARKIHTDLNSFFITHHTKQNIGLIDFWKGDYTDRSDAMEGLFAGDSNDCRETVVTCGNFARGIESGAEDASIWAEK